MKLSSYLILLAFVLSLWSCAGNADKEKNDSDIKTAQKNNSQQSGQEDFNQFLDNFSTDRIFQFQRIVFPITVSAPDANEITLTPTEEKIEKTGWELLDLTYDSSFATRDFDKYVQTVNFRKDTAHVSLRGIDNGIYADYYFKLIDGEWYLVTLVE